MAEEILLGIFTGNHAGAELRLTPGEYIIGSAQDCDVVLTDSSLEPRHCALLLMETGEARLSPLDGGICLTGEALNGSLDWADRTPVLAGLVCLAWTCPGKGWAGMKLPALLVTESSVPHGDAENRDSPGAKAQSAAGAAQGVKPATASSPEGKAAQRPTGSIPSPARRAMRLAPLCLGLLLLMGLTINLSLSGGQPEVKAEAMRKLLLAEGLPHLRVEENAGLVSIYGLAPTTNDANKIRSLAARQPYPVQVVVREQEDFIRAVQDALAGHGIFPHLRIENGEVTLLGYALDSLTRNAALSWARMAAPPVAEIRSAMLGRTEVEAALKEELTRAGLLEKIVLDWQPGEIILSGKETDKAALNRVMEATCAALASPLAFRLTTTAAGESVYAGREQSVKTPDPPRHDLPSRGSPFGEGLSLRSVTPAGRGALPFITTSDGAVYFIGGSLPSGYILTGIYPDRLEFSKNGSILAHKLQGR
jgi:type III secretion protein D